MWSFISDLKKNGPLLGIFVSLDSVYANQVIGNSGYDCVIIDMEHSPMSPREATGAAHAIAASSKGSCAPFIRAPSHGVEWIKWALDSGAAGTVVPMVESKEQAEGIVQRGRYYPVGSRSYGPSTAAFAHPNSDRSAATYFDNADKVAIFPMIETVTGVNNAEAILSVNGISGGFVGPSDLRVSLGLNAGDGTEDKFIEALKKIVEAGKKTGKPIGIFTPTKAAAERNIKLGFDFIVYEGDTSLLAKAARASVAEARSIIKANKL